ncbi:MAG TPA: hypothetical protein VOB72_11905 [Candidatus Dormibacteraeota bacterium]|nr:hypothetical protein [Candidatus Dormibacteraeota bacterium]
MIESLRATPLPHVARRLLVPGTALLLAVACGRVPTGGPPPGPPDSSFQALVAGAPDPQGNATTTRFDSATRRALAMPAPGNATAARFSGADRISYLLADSIQSQDVRGGAERVEAASRSLLMAVYAWSSRGVLAYLAQPPEAGTGRASELVIQRPGRPAVTVSLALGGRTLTADPPQLRFSPDGSLLMLFHPFGAGSAQATLQVRRLDGRLVFGPSGAGVPSDATWGLNGKLYFRDARGVNVADVSSGGPARTILPGVRWYRPDTAPDGRTIVFEVHDAGLPRFELLDTATDTVVPGFARAGAAFARFVSPTEIWFHPVAPCAPCGGTPAVRGEIVSLDTARLTEHATGLTGYLTDVRPGPAQRAQGSP